MITTKYLVYEVFPPIGQSQFVAVPASGEFGHMIGVKPESRVYSWYAESPESAIGMVQAFLNGPLGQQTRRRNMTSNYPPGVTGNEYQIAGPDYEHKVDGECPKCGERDVLFELGYHSSRWQICDTCGYQEDLN